LGNLGVPIPVSDVARNSTSYVHPVGPFTVSLVHRIIASILQYNPLGVRCTQKCTFYGVLCGKIGKNAKIGNFAPNLGNRTSYKKVAELGNSLALDYNVE